jgi:hypothetical protein
VGGHEPVKPRPSVRINGQKFMHLGLGSNQHGQTAPGACGPGMVGTGRPSEACPRRRTIRVPTHTFATRALPELPSGTPHASLKRLRLREERGGEDYFSKIKRTGSTMGPEPDMLPAESTMNLEGEIT